MAESPNEASRNMEVLEDSDEGKKKSKFKAFKNFFVKKKKKEPKEVQGGKRRKPNSNINNPSLTLVQEGQQPKPRFERNIRKKSLSHDSIFMLQPEPDRSTRKLYPSPEPQRGRSRERSYAYRTLPRTRRRRAVSRALFGVVPRSVTRNGTWVSGSKITEISPLCRRQPSLSPPPLRSDTVSENLEESSLDVESPKTLRKKALPQRMLTLRSTFDPLPILTRSQSLTTFAMLTSTRSIQQSISFGTSATDQSVLDSLAAQHKLNLNPRKQKKKKNLQVIEPSLPVVSEKKSKTKPKAVDQKKPKRDSAGPLNQKQNSRAEIYETTDQAANIDAAGTQDYPWSAAYGRQHETKGSTALGKSECGPRGRSFKQSSRGLGLGDIPGSPPADKIARGSSFRHSSLEKQAEAAAPLELLSEKNDMGRRKLSLLRPIPKDMKESMVRGPLQYHEAGVSGTNKSEARASLLPVVERPSTTRDAMFSVAGEAQVCMDPSHIQSEEEDASGFDSQGVQFKMESAQDISTLCKEKRPGSVHQDFAASPVGVASVLADRGISVERLPLRSLPQLEAEEAFSVSDDSSEAESGVEQQLAPGDFFQPSEKSEDEEVSDSESASEDGSGSEQQLDPNYSFQLLGKPEDDPEAFIESSSFLRKLSSSHEHLGPRCSSQASGEPEDEVSRESNSYFEKYNDSKDWSSSEEDLPLRHHSLALGNPNDQQEVSSVSKYTSEERGVSVEHIPPSQLPQPFVTPLVEQQLPSGSMGASSSEWLPMPPRHLSQSRMSIESKQQASSGPENAVLDWSDWGTSMQPLPPRMPSKRLSRRHVKHPSISNLRVSITRGIEYSELQPLRNHSQPPVKPVTKQEISAGPESTAVEGRISMEPLPPKVYAQPLMNPKVEQNVFLGSEGAEKVIAVEPPFPGYCPQCLTNRQAPCIFSDKTAGNEGMFAEMLPPKYPYQPMVKLQFQPQSIPCHSGSASTEWSGPMEMMPPRRTVYPWVSTGFDQQPSSGPGSIPVGWGIPIESLPPRMPSQPLMRPVGRKELLGSMGAPAEWSGLVQPVSPRHTLPSWVNPRFEQQAYAGPECAVAERSISVEPLRMPSQPLLKPVVQQPISACPESVATEGNTSSELPPPRHWSIVRHRIQQMMPSLENAAVEGVIAGRPLSPNYPVHILRKPEVQEIPPPLENPDVEGDTFKDSLYPGRPSQSFVKFMAQHFFSESPDINEQVHVNPLSSNQPSKSSLRPKVEHQVFSGANVEGGISAKLLPMKCPFQSLERPKDPQEAFSYPESSPVRVSCPQDQLPPRFRPKAWGKPEYRQEVSVSDSSLEELRCYEEQLPSRCPFEAEEGSGFQPQVYSTGSVSVPAGKSSAEDRPPPRHSFQALADPEYQQQVYSSSVSAAAKGTIFESNPRSWSLPRSPVSPNETKKHSQGSEVLIKTIPTPATKFEKFIIAPPWRTSTSGNTYSKEDVLESSDQNIDYSNSSTSQADIENLFGVRLRRASFLQKYKRKKQDRFTKLPPLSLDPISSSLGGESQIESAPQGLLGIAETLTTSSDFVEDQQSKSKSDSTPKKQSAYKIPGKAPGQQSDYATSEPTWIAMAKQMQRNFLTESPMKELKTKNEAEEKAETKEVDLTAQSQQRKIFTSNVVGQEKMKPESTKTVKCENQNKLQEPAMRKETRPSSAHPAMFQEPVEPVWFSMAKKKAKAWSYIAEIMR